VSDFVDDFTLMTTTAQNGTVTVTNYVDTNRNGTTAEFYIKADTPNFGEFNTTGYPVVQRVGETLTNGILRLKYGYTGIASVHLVLGDYRVVGQNYIELIHDNFTNSLRATHYPNQALVANVGSGWADGYSMQLEVYGNYVVIKALDANETELNWAEGYLDVAIGDSIFFSGSSASKKLYELEKREITALFTHKFWNLGASPNDFTLPTSLPSTTTQKREVRWEKNPLVVSNSNGIDVLEGFFSTTGGTLRITHDDGVQLTVDDVVIHERNIFTITPIAVGTIAAGTHSLKLIHTQAILPNLCILEINEGGGWKVVTASAATIAPPELAPFELGQFEVYQPARAPAFLQDQTARVWNAELGAAKDRLLDRAAESVRARALTLNTDDAALQIGVERSMPRYLSETMQQYRTRVLAAWESKKFQGTVKGIRDELLAMGYESSVVLERTSAGNWSEFTVRINSSSITNWNAHLTLEVKTRVVLAVLRLKSAHTKLRAITAGSSDILFYKQLRWGERPVGQKWRFVSRKWRQGVIL
jgi:hypothetical protein